MVDGIDGSGKSSAIDAWKDYLTKEGNTLFDLKHYWKTHGTYPKYSELKSYDFILSGEPTYAGVGKVIRDELIATGNSYPQSAVAEAYSLDRLILYTNIIIPALRDGKCVIQDRGVSTSLCYQPLADSAITTQFLQSLSGNALALEHAPTVLVLVSVDVDLAMRRLTARTHKQDNVIFEKHSFLEKAAATFANADYQALFTSRGTTIHTLSGDDEIGIMKEKSVDLLKKILS